MKNKIQQWINEGKDFEKGIELLPKSGIYDNLARVCKLQGYTKSNADTVEYWLFKLAGIPYRPAKKKKKIIATNAPKSSIELIPENTGEITDEIKLAAGKKIREEFAFLNNKTCPDELKILVADRITAYYTYVNDHKKLFDCNPDDRFNVAKSVVLNFKENSI